MAKPAAKHSLPVPAPAQIALALVTLRSKPAHLSIEEHLSNLRKSVVRTNSSQKPRLVDTGLLWKHAFERSQDELQQLQAELTRLRAQAEKDSKSSSKRKPEYQTAAQANIQSKRRKTERDDDVEDGSPSPLPEQTPTVFTLARSSSDDNVSTATITMRVNVLCESMIRCIENSVISSGDLNLNAPPPEMAVSQILPRVVNAYTILLSTVESLSAYNRQDDPLPRLVSSLSNVFATMLGRLNRLTLDELTRKEEMERSRKKRTKPNSKAAQDSPQRDEAAFAESATSLVWALGRCITLLNLENGNHCRLLKALLTALLDHIGSSLSLLIFSDPGAGEGIDPPMGVQHVAHIDTASAILAAEVETPYLIAILKPVLAHLREKQVSLPIRSRESLSGSREAIDNNTLADKIEKRLQDTLMRGVFGDEDRKFQQAFTREPSPASEDVQATLNEAVREEDRSSWFVGQLWELLGWDILSGKLAARS